jgi:hypothetical protein
MLRTIWRKYFADQIAARVAQRVQAIHGANNPDRILERFNVIEERFNAIEERFNAIESKMALVDRIKLLEDQVYIPNPDVQGFMSGEFLRHSTCNAGDFLHSEFNRYCSDIGLPPVFHRKMWEWVFIMHHARRTGSVGEGKCALGFGVGVERLPSFFASLATKVTATDAPPDIGIGHGWQSSGEYSSDLNDLFYPNIVREEEFARLVNFTPCDMTKIPPSFKGFNFCWSACSLEHLGSLRAGMDFIIETVEKTLVTGGVACHTTELNLSSNDKTLEEGGTVLYRKRDIVALVDELERRGHKVEPFSVAPNTLPIDNYVDVPPYQAAPHLKIRLLEYVCTSVGLIITRGS